MRYIKHSEILTEIKCKRCKRCRPRQSTHTQQWDPTDNKMDWTEW